MTLGPGGYGFDLEQMSGIARPATPMTRLPKLVAPAVTAAAASAFVAQRRRVASRSMYSAASLAGAHANQPSMIASRSASLVTDRSTISTAE